MDATFFFGNLQKVGKREKEGMRSCFGGSFCWNWKYHADDDYVEFPIFGVKVWVVLVFFICWEISRNDALFLPDEEKSVVTIGALKFNFKIKFFQGKIIILKK